MTEREQREGTGETKDNVRDEHDEASKGRKKDATQGSVEEEASGGGGGPVEQVQDTVGGLTGGLTGGGGDDEEESTGGGGGVKDNVQDEHEKTQRH